MRRTPISGSGPLQYEITFVSKARSLNTVGANTAGSSGRRVTSMPTAPSCWRISSPYLANVGEVHEVERQPRAVGDAGDTARHPRRVTFLLPADRVEQPLGLGPIERWQIQPAAWAHTISLEIGAVATLPSLNCT